MELFQELVFTISFSLIVSLLIAKLFSVSDGGSSAVSISVEEKIEKEWVVCDSEKEEKPVCVEDPVKVSELGSGVVIKPTETVGGVVIKPIETVGGVGDCKVFDESPDRTNFDDADVNSVKSDENHAVESVVSLIQEDFDVHDQSSTIDVGEVKFDDDDDDDWQGVETTELEKRFGAAVAFMDSKSSVDRMNLIDNEVKIQLYGLHKVAIEGSCFEPQPMALKVSARANWNSWKRLENLGREDAMEQYISLLSQHVPDWMGSHASDKRQ